MDYNVKMFKLVSGEEVLAKVTETLDDGGFVITDARTLIPFKNGNGQIDFEVIPFMLSDADAIITLKPMHILGVNSNVPDRLRIPYINGTSNVQILTE